MTIDKEKLMNEMFKGAGDLQAELQGESRVVPIPLDRLHDFHTGEGHPFSVEDDEDMEELFNSILECGQLEPAIVRPDKKYKGDWEVITGHRRKYIAIKQGRSDLECIIRNLDDASAIRLMVASNIMKRKNIKPSVMAKALKMYMDANKKGRGRKPKKSQKNLVQVEPNFYTRDALAKEQGMSAASVQRTLRLNNLIEPLLALVDDGKLKQTVAVELSYLTPEEQEHVFNEIDCSGRKVSLSMAQDLHRISKAQQDVGKSLSVDDVDTCLIPEEKKFILNEKYLTRFLPPELRSSSPEEKADFIVKAIKRYIDTPMTDGEIASYRG